MSVVFFTDRDLGTLFAEVLRQAGFSVERHRDHLPPDSPDEDWLRIVGERGWVALSRDRRIRYKPNELAAIVEHRVRLLVVVGKVPHSVLAESFVASRQRVDRFLARNPNPPLIAKIYRAAPEDLRKNPQAPGRIERWYPRS